MRQVTVGRVVIFYCICHAVYIANCQPVWPSIIRWSVIIWINSLLCLSKSSWCANWHDWKPSKSSNWKLSMFIELSIIMSLSHCLLSKIRFSWIFKLWCNFSRSAGTHTSRLYLISFLSSDFGVDVIMFSNEILFVVQTVLTWFYL